MGRRRTAGAPPTAVVWWKRKFADGPWVCSSGDCSHGLLLGGKLGGAENQPRGVGGVADAASKPKWSVVVETRFGLPHVVIFAGVLRCGDFCRLKFGPLNSDMLFS